MNLRKQNKSFYVVVFSAILILVSILYEGTYAYIVRTVLGTGNQKNNQTSVITANMTDLVLTGDTLVANSNMIPGESITSTFTVTNENNIGLCFELYWTDVTNTFVNKNDLVVTLSDSDGNVLIDNQPFPSATSTIQAGIYIAANTVQTYNLTITYLNTDEDQMGDMGKSFGGTIASDLSACPIPESENLDFEVLSGTYSLASVNQSIPVVISNNHDNEIVGNILYKNQILDSFILKANSKGMYNVFLTEDLFNSLEEEIRNYLTIQITSPYVLSTEGQVVFVKKQEAVSIISVTSSDTSETASYTENTLNVINTLSETKPSVTYTITVRNNIGNDTLYKFRNITELYNENGNSNYTLSMNLSDGILLESYDEYTFDITYSYDSSSDNYQRQILYFDFREFVFEGVTDKLITVSAPATVSRYGDFIPSGSTSSLEGVEDSANTCSYDTCYSDNNGEFEYDTDGGLVLDGDNAIGELEIDQSMGVDDEYTMYVTLKGDFSQVGTPTQKYAATVLAISEEGAKYLSWIGFYSNYLHVYSYRNGTSMKELAEEYTEQAFASINVSAYSNKIINIQVTAIRGGDTKVYINGTLIHTFTSGADEVSYKSATLGDLRPGRGLKFTGVLYDIGLYNKALSEDEVQINWEYAKTTWNIT